MDLECFMTAFDAVFPENERTEPELDSNVLDPCPDVVGMASPRKLRLLNLAVSCLPADGSECYFEVGTYQGKSLIAALLGHTGRTAVACDNFSQFDHQAGNGAMVRQNLERYALSGHVRFCGERFQELLGRWPAEGLPPIGVYFYDGAHDEASQYEAIRAVEPHLADCALALIDDWRWANDSHSYAEQGTRRALRESTHSWELCWELPARYNGDLDLWWNGVAILTFRRQSGTAP